MSKVDGRKTVQFMGSFSYKIRESQKQRIINRFLETESSVHSNLALTLGIIVEYCIKYNISFILTKQKQGYFIRKL